MSSEKETEYKEVPLVNSAPVSGVPTPGAISDTYVEEVKEDNKPVEVSPKAESSAKPS